MFDYDVMTEEEAMKERFQLLDDGEYDAVIDTISERLSSTGNNMIEVNLSVYDKNGKPHPIRDFWVFTPKMMWKIIHGCKSAGLSVEYENKTFNPVMLSGKCVRVLISTQTGKMIPNEKLNGKPQGSVYPDKNSVDDYIACMTNVTKASQPVDDGFGDKDVPF